MFSGSVDSATVPPTTVLQTVALSWWHGLTGDGAVGNRSRLAQAVLLHPSYNISTLASVVLNEDASESASWSMLKDSHRTFQLHTKFWGKAR